MHLLQPRFVRRAASGFPVAIATLSFLEMHLKSGLALLQVVKISASDFTSNFGNDLISQNTWSRNKFK